VSLTDRKLTLRLCLALASLTLFCYLPSAGHEFISIDDHQYVTDNPHVTGGLTWQNIAWAFRSGYACNWHPLTWISHMLDCQLFGLEAGGQHLTNVFYHVVNTVLVFVVFSRMTGRIWPSAFLAAFFGWHPVHVESVAWISERKDVLSAFFWLLSLLAYQRYVKCGRDMLWPVKPTAELDNPPRDLLRAGERKTRWYLITLLFFAFGLMSKPMVVTLPFVLLLLDFWPLQRITLEEIKGTSVKAARLVCEKLPFFVLAILSSIITFYVQDKGGATSSLASIPLTLRLENSVVAYASYVGKMIWPAKLMVLYPYTGHLPAAQICAASIFLLAVTSICLKGVKRFPFLTVGWLWFVGTLVPVIGLVQVGSQSMADRYTYIPSMGFFVVLIWGSLSWLDRFPNGKVFLSSCALTALGCCLALTSVQLRYWQSSLRLSLHSIEVDPNNYLACNALGKALDDLGKHEEAFAWFSKSVALAPCYSEGQYNLAASFVDQGMFQQALLHFKLALWIDPGSANALHGLGNTFLKLGKFKEAAEQLSKAIRLEPGNAGVHHDLGVVLLKQGNLAAAATEFSEAVRLNPNHLDARRNLGVTLAEQGRPTDALPHLKRAVELAPADPAMRFNYGLALMEAGAFAAAEIQFKAGARLRPQESRFHYRLAVTYARQRKYAEAIEQYGETIRLAPEFPEGLNELAWILSTCPNGDLRSGNRATSLAEKACELTAHKNPEMLSTLAAAYAESGRFPEAIGTARVASRLAREKGQTEFLSKFDQWLSGYEAGKPARESL
jgi:protein O-mannosyl-transferase